MGYGRAGAEVLNTHLDLVRLGQLLLQPPMILIVIIKVTLLDQGLLASQLVQQFLVFPRYPLFLLLSCCEV